KVTQIRQKNNFFFINNVSILCLFNYLFLLIISLIYLFSLIYVCLFSVLVCLDKLEYFSKLL
ncbi:MAG: hypothetical protein K6253_02840, partial [Candidatus Liberibacter asiaticus]|nr:hypothetical protein [Candidatus Liberibacter asiaticus]